MSQVHLIIPALNAGALWSEVIEGIQAQRLAGHGSIGVTVVDSQSSDHTVPLALQAGFQVERIQKESFAHGATRQEALERVSKEVQWVIFMTQDAVLEDPRAFEALLKPFENPKVVASYGRQLPHHGASWMASQLRAFNYPPEARTTGWEDRFTWGLKATFLSNSFAAYRVSAVSEVGGFSRAAILGEDMLMGAKLLKAGHLIAYAPQALVLHSHNDTLWQDFQRYFDTGVMHAQEKALLADFGQVNQQGFALLRFLMRQLQGLGAWACLLQALTILARLQTKYVAYQLGRHHALIPLCIKRRLSMSKNHWQ